MPVSYNSLYEKECDSGCMAIFVSVGSKEESGWGEKKLKRVMLSESQSSSMLSCFGGKDVVRSSLSVDTSKTAHGIKFVMTDVADGQGNRHVQIYFNSSCIIHMSWRQWARAT
jgi:hypothetical protein